MRPIHMAWASACIARAKTEDAILVNEYTLMPEHCGSNLPGSYFGSSPASGLGWGGGAALGAKLAAPDRLVIAILGRRLAPVRQPGRGPPRLRGAQAAGAVRRHEQFDVGRGAARDTRHVPAGRSGAQQQAAADRPRRVPGLRSRSAPPPAAMASGSRTRPRCRRRSSARSAPSPSKNARPSSMSSAGDHNPAGAILAVAASTRGRVKAIQRTY